jgi:hypothetical protein
VSTPTPPEPPDRSLGPLEKVLPQKKPDEDGQWVQVPGARRGVERNTKTKMWRNNRSD